MIKMKKKISLVIMAFAFVACGENDTPKRITPVIPQEEYVIVNETCHQCRGYGAIATMYGPIPCNNCNGQGTVSVKRKINRSNISFKDSDCCTWHDCSCPRFEPTKGSVYNNSICKNCGHPKGKHTCGDL